MLAAQHLAGIERVLGIEGRFDSAHHVEGDRILHLFEQFDLHLTDSVFRRDRTAEPGDDFDFFSDQPIAEDQLVELPPPRSAWVTVGGPVALLGFFFLQMFFYWWMVPFQVSKVDVNLHDFPTGAKRIKEPAQGVYATFVNGEMLMKEGQHTGALPGRVLRNTHYKANHA